MNARQRAQGVELRGRAAGAAQIYVVEPSEERRAKAMELGATRAMDPTDTDVVAEIRAATGSGVNVAFEVTGVPKVLAQVIDSTRHEGQALIVSIWETEASFQPNTVVLSERQIKGTIGYRNVYPTYHVPRIGGQSVLYLSNALHEYRKGTRKHPTMQAQATIFSDEDIAAIAAYLSSLKPQQK